MNEQGRKNDKDKIRYDLITPESLEDLAKVLTMGAKKYAPNNWQKVKDGEQRYYAALMRHLEAFRQGEYSDKESGLPHMAHVLCNAMFLHYIGRMERESIDIRPNENRDSTILTELRRIIEYGLSNDNETNNNTRANLREFSRILSEIWTYVSFGTFNMYHQGDGSIKIIFGANNSTSYYVTHVSKSTLSRLQELSNNCLAKAKHENTYETVV